MRLKQEGARSVEILLWSSSWYGARPDPQLSQTGQLFTVGNDFFGDAPAAAQAVAQLFFKESPAELTLQKLSRALDDLRRLGQADVRLNHPEHAMSQIPTR